MIIRDRPGPRDLLFALRGSVLPTLLPALAVIGIWTSALMLLDAYGTVLPHLSPTPFTVLGVALSLFLGFRNNAAYDRWWEARRLWGGLLADTRSLVREAALFLPDPQDRDRLLRAHRAFLHLHRCALRNLPPDALARRDGDHATAEAALDAVTVTLTEALRAGRLDGFGARTLSERMASIALAQSGSERIRLTPLPYVYSLLIFRTAWAYCALLPFALLDSPGTFAPLFTVLVAYTFLGLAEVTEDLAHPFGPTPNAMPLDAICRACDIALATPLGEPVPPPLAPKGFRLD